MEFAPGDIFSYTEMCLECGVSLQRGMNFRLNGKASILLMSRRRGAPYRDRIEEDGRVLIYEGHDTPKRQGIKNPKRIDQPEKNPGGTPTQNSLFAEAAKSHKQMGLAPEPVFVYEKIQAGIWAFNGVFLLTDAWQESDGKRKVFKFRLELSDDSPFPTLATRTRDIPHERIIPSAVKLAVWNRDKGKCVKCGASDNLHYDHDIPYSKGGTSIDAKNVQLLCVRHNLEKHDKIE
jgi:hypothetical protein